MNIKKREKKTPIIIRVPLSLKQAFKKKCDKQGLYMTDVIEAMLSKFTGRN